VARKRELLAGGSAEAELCEMIAQGVHDGPGRPDRPAAMVSAITVLGVTRSGVPRVRRL
jgi:phage terminase large subunit-like protein